MLQLSLSALGIHALHVQQLTLNNAFYAYNVHTKGGGGEKKKKEKRGESLSLKCYPSIELVSEKVRKKFNKMVPFISHIDNT